MQSPLWPRAVGDKLRQKTEGSAQHLKDDYSYLLTMNKQLYELYTEAVGTLMNEIVIAESREAIMQTTRMGKLTFLAFLFLPLSFTTSFFGANLQELGGDKDTLSIWVWSLVSVPLLLCAILFYTLDILQKWRGFKVYVYGI
ncbi:hypothetical protein G7Y79_00012g033730 [Physcia stellaris]|nr:hypothetical protein G7Y79_00012g033730 [Physcia stellaris]